MPLFEPRADAAGIPGLTMVREFVATEEAAELGRRIDEQPWRHDLKRRVQHYGYRYDYAARTIGSEARLGPLPDWLLPLAARLAAPEWLGAAPDQVIVNEYLPGQGIAGHVDCLPCFGPRIAIVSLGSATAMLFTHPSTAASHQLILEPRSLTLLAGPARTDWRHAIAARKSDLIDGARLARGRRVSVTFRTVRLAGARRLGSPG